MVRVARDPLARGRIHQRFSQEPRKLLGHLPRLGKVHRLRDGDRLRDPLAGELHRPGVGRVFVAAGKVHLHLPDCIQHVLHALHRHEKPPPLNDPPPPTVEDDPAAPEDESGPDGGEHGAEQDDQGGKEGPLGAVFDGDEPEGDLHDEQARQQEGEPEDRDAAAPAANLEGARIPVSKGAFLPCNAGPVKEVHVRYT
jgi:hypothetical protein